MASRKAAPTLAALALASGSLSSVATLPSVSAALDKTSNIHDQILMRALHHAVAFSGGGPFLFTRCVADATDDFPPAGDVDVLEGHGPHVRVPFALRSLNGGIGLLRDRGKLVLAGYNVSLNSTEAQEKDWSP